MINGYLFLKILIFPSKKKIYSNCEKRWNNMLNLGAINEVKKIMIEEKVSKKRNFPMG